ncbi:bacteriophage abortive infection AbiH family protein [Pseudoalteromonas undina]|uniref:bacteriophage abortive infection AbiH family protein n=1 Tax=Pseudoalteromonas undina TaxID=43660 RepID=UPI001F51F894|nr:bacteriophage abortive infection AbiH family protein [Pseudoalteromonas undina]
MYLIGNGFDLNLGLRSSYKDFYNHYKSHENDSSVIKSFKSNISKDLDKWSDLEMALGEYTKAITSIDELDEIHGSIVDELADYLDKAQDEFIQNKLDSVNADKFLDDLFKPEKFLLYRDANALRHFYAVGDRSANIYNIINFNYTHTLELIIGLENKLNRNQGLSIERVGNSSHSLNSIFHVHGTIDSDMVLGVDSNEQIFNEELSKNIDATNQLIKRECNLVMRHGIEADSEKLISIADLICIFGSSMGKTDQIWWDLISNQLQSRNCRLIIFEYLPGVNQRRSQLLERRRQEVLRRLSSAEEFDTISKRVYFSFNSEIFSLNQ